MDFETFRSLKGWSLDDAAAELRKTGRYGVANINPTAIGKHERGIRFPPPDTVEAYAEITDGAVTYNDWLRVREAGVAPPRPRGPKKRALADA